MNNWRQLSPFGGGRGRIFVNKVTTKIRSNPRKSIIVTAFIALLIWYIFCLPQKLFNTPYSTVVADRNHELLGARIATDNQWRFPPTDTIPEKFKICIIEFEDQYFYFHWGVNPLSIARASWQNLKAKCIVSGGSTITMQTIRLARKEKRTYGEKLIEIIWATRLEFRYSKGKILALYASHAPFGGNVVGLDAAAWRYFGHSSNDLSWAEAATLAVLPNAPASIHLSKNRKTLVEKRNRLLKKLYDRNIIDKTTYELALYEVLPESPLPLPQTAPHLVSYFYKNNKGEYCISSVEKGMQMQVENILNQWHEEFVRSDIKNMAAIVIDVQKNQVIAYCGNVDFNNKNSGNQVDVIRSPRSSGSILKPFLYCAMLEEGELLPNTLIPDIPLNINGFTPQNFNRQFDGAVPASEALARSLNVPAVQELRKYSVPKFYDYLKKSGITTLNQPASFYGLALILGGAEVSLWDVTSVYNNMAKELNGYIAQKEIATGYPEILQNPGKKDTKTTHQTDKDRIGAIYQTFQALKEVNRPEEIDWRHISSIQEIAWKTGTSYGFRDAWAVGITPRYVVGVWVGNSAGDGKPELTGARTAGPIMFDIFNILPSSSWFKKPSNVFVETEICSQSGCLKGPYCEQIDTTLICSAGLKTEACPYHVLINVTEDEHFRVYENCAGNDGIKQTTWFVLPPAWAMFYKQHHTTYKNLPPFKPGCDGSGEFRVMQFVYPQSGARISMTKLMDGSKSELVFELAHLHPDATVYWHLDGDYVGSTDYFHKMALIPSIGDHIMTVVDNEGNTLSVSFKIE